MDATTVAVDLAKDIFEVACANRAGRVVWLLLDEARAIEARLATIDQPLAQIARAHPIARRLQQIPGIGVLAATARFGAVNHIHAFRRGHNFASWLGFAPREVSTGRRRYLDCISKRGDVYLRCLLTHGARAVLPSAQRTARAAPHRTTRFQQWAGTQRGIQAKQAARLRLILGALKAATTPQDLNLPGLALHELQGDRKGTWAVKVSGNGRVTFRFAGKDADRVDYEDYH
jgi:proteic killer suppression protein